jgi:predicted nuclease of predicted toxin-antitoxin system
MKKVATILTVLIAAAVLSVSTSSKNIESGYKLINLSDSDKAVQIATISDKFVTKDVCSPGVIKQDKFAIAAKDTDFADKNFIAALPYSKIGTITTKKVNNRIDSLISTKLASTKKEVGFKSAVIDIKSRGTGTIVTKSIDLSPNIYKDVALKARKIDIQTINS